MNVNLVSLNTRFTFTAFRVRAEYAEGVLPPGRSRAVSVG